MFRSWMNGISILIVANWLLYCKCKNRACDLAWLFKFKQSMQFDHLHYTCVCHHIGKINRNLHWRDTILYQILFWEKMGGYRVVGALLQQYIIIMSFRCLVFHVLIQWLISFGLVARILECLFTYRFSPILIIAIW